MRSWFYLNVNEVYLHINSVSSGVGNAALGKRLVRYIKELLHKASLNRKSGGDTKMLDFCFSNVK